MLKLLTRLYEPLEGQILIDGNDVSKVDLYSLRAQIGVVPQDSLLFDGSVMSNIEAIETRRIIRRGIISRTSCLCT